MFEVNQPQEDLQAFAAQLEHLGLADLTTLLDQDQDASPDVVADLTKLDEGASDQVRGA
jgi:hypothetical protein